MTFLTALEAGFPRLPRWVQFWLACILVPVNLISIVFVGEPGGWIVAVLAIGGIALNAVVLAVTRELGREMAFAHLILWPPLIVVIIWLLGSGLIAKTRRLRPTRLPKGRFQGICRSALQCVASL